MQLFTISTNKSHQKLLNLEFQPLIVMNSQNSEVFAYSKEVPNMEQLISTSKIASSKHSKYQIRNVAFHRYKNSIDARYNATEQYDTFNDNGGIMNFRVNRSKMKQYQDEEYRE